MRRGGGSRGGSFGGSRGGGFRGGGMSRSRINRSSRRHHRHRPYYRSRHRPYYRRRRYWGGYYGPYRRSGGIGGLIVFLFIVLLVVAIFVAGAASSSDNYDITLAPGTTYAIDYSDFSDDLVTIDVVNGQLETYVFDREPQTTAKVDKYYNFSGTLGISDYEYYGLSLSAGTQLRTTWESTGVLTYYAIKGENNLNQWEEGDSEQFYDDYGTSGTHDYTVNRPDTYFFAVESYSPNNEYQIEFMLSIPVHDLSNPNEQFTGSQMIGAPDGNSLVLYNPGTESSRVRIEITSSFDFGTVFIGIIVTVSVVLYLTYRRSKRDDDKKSTLQPDTTENMPQRSSESLVNKDHTKSKYKTRPDAKYCSSCGSAVLPGSSYCMECGSAL